MILRISLIRLKLLLLRKNWSNSGAGEVSMPLMATDLVDGIFESDISTSHEVTAAIRLATIVTAICPVLATMLLEISVNGV